MAVASCSDDSAKSAPPATVAGAAGAPSASGGTADNGGNGTGGVDSSAGGSNGVAGSAEGAGASGEAGAPAIPAGALVLFTVSAGSIGLTSTGVAAAVNPQSMIFASATANPAPVNGTNEVAITAAQLGLTDFDAIDAFAVMQRTPAHALYWFSVSAGADDTAGERPTRLARSAQQAEAIGDVYFSDATLSFRSLGERGDLLGYNALVADEQSLGLSPAAPEESHVDDLTGVKLLPDGRMPSEIYFSVDANSGGLRGSVVAATSELDRPCTIFKSSLNGQNSVAFSCAALGLGANSDVKALVVYGGAAPTEVLFAVDRASTGLAGTAVETAPNLPSDIFASPLDGTNTLRVEGNALGLAVDDRLDALAVVDRAPPSYGFSATCHLSPAPDAPEGAGVTSVESAHQLGTGLILVAGPTAAAVPSDGIGAYDLRTCELVARAPVASNALQGRNWAPVPLSGWSATTPFSKLEYWRLTADGSGVEQLDSSGALLTSYGLAGIESGAFNGLSLDYDPVYDHFYAVITAQTGFYEYDRLYFPHPAPGTASGAMLDVVSTPIPHPCAHAPALSGVDANGNSVYAQLDTGAAFRVCTFSPAAGEFAALPYSWTLDTELPDFAVLVPEDALYALVLNHAFAVERYALPH